MTGQPIRRAAAVLAAAVLTAALAATALAAEVEAAQPKPRCLGQEATIAGTNGPDVLVGTAKRDVIVGRGGDDIIDGRGGNDLICGGRGADRLIGKGGRDRLYGNAGPDRLFGGSGPDRLFGGVGNDLLAGQVGSDLLGGGPGTDTCYQGQGTGRSISCELPAPPPVVPAPAPPPPAPKPTPKVLVIAYSDLDGNDAPTPGDVMISQIVDTNADGTVSVGDTIEMGRYPTNAAPTTMAEFAAWETTSHEISYVADTPANQVYVRTTSLAEHRWYLTTDTTFDTYKESLAGKVSHIADDHKFGGPDFVDINRGSPSEPATDVHDTADADSWRTDDPLIDVDRY